MSELDDLAGLLRDKTFEGKLKWQFVADDRISVKQGNSVIDISKYLSFYSISLRNVNGVVLSSQTYSSGSQIGMGLKELFERARRDALGIDEAISDVKQRLLHL